MTMFADAASAVTPSAAAGVAVYVALLAEARAVVATVMTLENCAPEEAAAALHLAAGDDIADETLTALAGLLAA